ncbi:MAG: ferric reductase [Actinomycetia bacterium]|nr:ferric reductase [Actinomycetes bacterium]
MVASDRLAVRHAARRDRAWDVGVVVVANAVVTVGLWLRHGGLGGLGDAGGPATAVGQLTGLLGTYAVLVELLLMSRIGWLERAIGFDRLAVWHRWTGFATVWLLAVHAGSITWGYAAGDHRSIGGQVGAFIRHYPDVLMSIVGLTLFLAVAVGSVRAARRRLSRESWYGLHLYAYLAVALAFAHQLAVGTDFSGDRLARAWWIALYLATGAAILAWRVGRPVAFNLRHRLRVSTVQPEADGVVSVYLTGRRLDAVGADAGQFFLWRFLTGWGWAKAHPFSLSAAPRPDLLRITVKDLGDDTHRMLTLRPGTRVFAEGPYGTFTADRRGPRRVALIAGGIGITPLRALLDVLPTQHRGDVTLLYRVAAKGEVAFRPELAAFQERRGVDVHVLVDPVIGDDRTDGLGVPALQRLVPDLAVRDVYVCGPPAMVDAVRRRLELLRVPKDQVHFERFQY